MSISKQGLDLASETYGQERDAMDEGRSHTSEARGVETRAQAMMQEEELTRQRDNYATNRGTGLGPNVQGLVIFSRRYNP